MLSELSTQELLQLSSEGDAQASMELIRRQRRGDSRRLYPEPRRGPLDEGVAPFVFSVNGFNIEIHTGIVGRGVRVRRKEVSQIVNSLISLMTSISINAVERQGAASKNASSRLCQTRTPGFDVKCTKDGDALALHFLPADTASWCLDLRGARLVIAALLFEAKEIGWGWREMGFTHGEVTTAVDVVKTAGEV